MSDTAEDPEGAVPVVAPGADPTVVVPSAGRPGAAQDRLASWIADLTGLHELLERLCRTTTPEAALRETLRAGAGLAGARRGMLALRPTDPDAPERTVGFGLAPCDLGAMETVPRSSDPCARLLDEPLPVPATGEGPPGDPPTGDPDTDAPPGSGGPTAEITLPDIAADRHLAPRYREVASRLGIAAGYAQPLTVEDGRRIGAAVWFYDEPGLPDARQRHLLALYLRQAGAHIANRLELSRARSAVREVREGLLPRRLPHLPGVALAVRRLSADGPGTAGPEGTGGADGAGEGDCGTFHEALVLPEQALGLAMGSVTGTGPRVVAAMGRLLAGLRAYAVMEGEDPVAVLSDLELLLRVTESVRCATALFGYVDPTIRRLVIASAGHPPPLIIGDTRVQYAETTLSAPLGMLTCWEAPSVEVELRPGETVLLCSEGLLRRLDGGGGAGTGSMDRAFARLHATAARAPAAVRRDPGALADHVLRSLPAAEPPGSRPGGEPGDAVVLAARF
ncbi:PP2C family protein-serine/threonine phosphatase [Streptomyces sp. ST2-7A]|uniref:PP2C family protein-serine/threonine phosphatase n=1 Tax=Streptomyces sp. ST2-7A TaxID=2907214 RepID=UPI001F3D060B|nr:PP2C family protein-serine/threonine phosphatase [Streptomyces sp. ST2-7A]MCE7080412.1 serine/threonine-protein phosphatase [Streptomyces sp. ST2-7A]